MNRSMWHRSVRRANRAARAGSAALLLVLAAGIAQSGTVVIVEGNDTPDNDFLHSLGGAAVTNYTNKGYTINRLSNQPAAKTEQEIKDAINAAGVNAVVFLGHGGVNAAGGGVPALVHGYPSDGDESKILRPGDLTGDYSGIKHVEIQACSQNLQAWKDKFPNAMVDAWSKCVTGDQMANDVANGSPGRIPQKNPPPPPPPPPAPVKSTDRRFDEAIRSCPQGKSTQPDADFINDWLQFNFQLRPELIPVFPSVQFNVRVFDPDTGFLPLRGMVMNNGNLVFNPLGGLPTAQFNFTIDSDAFAIAMANIDTVPQLYAEGRIRIENNISGRPPDLCFRAAADAYFGLFSLPPVPPCLGDLNGDGLINTGDLVNFLSVFGQPVPFGHPADFDGNGIVNVSDLVGFLAVFGTAC